MHLRPKRMKPRFKILATNWQPKKLNAQGLGSAMRHLLNKNGLEVGKFPIEIRSPKICRGVAPLVLGWHQDTNGAARSIVLWSNKMPTMLRNKRSKRIIKINPKDVIIFHNKYFEHRAPRGARKALRRWFVRHHLLMKECPRGFFR